MSTLQVTIWDVQHGSSIYAKTPNNRHIMFDLGVGSYTKGKDFSPVNWLYKRYNVDKLDYLVISHPHGDHIDDLNNITVSNDSFVKSMMYPKGGRLSKEFILKENQSNYSGLIERYYRLKRNVKQREQIINDATNFGNVRVKCFQQTEKGSSNLNNYSVVSFLSFGNDTMLIPGDIEESGWKALMENNNFLHWLKRTTVFVASHHGRNEGYYQPIFGYFTPKIIVISDGKYTRTSRTDLYSKKIIQPRKFRRERDGKIIEKNVLTTRSNGFINFKFSNNDVEAIKVERI